MTPAEPHRTALGATRALIGTTLRVPSSAPAVPSARSPRGGCALTRIFEGTTFRSGWCPPARARTHEGLARTSQPSRKGTPPLLRGVPVGTLSTDHSRRSHRSTVSAPRVLTVRHTAAQAWYHGMYGRGSTAGRTVPGRIVPSNGHVISSFSPC